MARAAEKPRGKLPPPRAGVEFWDSVQQKWRYRPHRGKVVDLHSPEGERAFYMDKGRLPGGGRGFSGRRALRRAGAVVDRGATRAAGASSSAGRTLAAPSVSGALSLSELVVYVFGSVLALSLLEAALSGRGPATVNRVFGLVGVGLSKLTDPQDTIFGRSAATGYASSLPAESQAVADRTAGVSPEVQAGVAGQTVAGHKIIGLPFEGTHAKAFNVAGGSDNWQSENADDVAAKKGTPVYAVVAGVIGRAGSTGEGGRFAGQRVNLSGAGNSFYYAHLSKLAPGVREGATVKRGQLLGYTGEANGVEHLHFAAATGDPIRWLRLVFAPPTAKRTVAGPRGPLAGTGAR